MDICVCVKLVPREAVQVRIDPERLRLGRTGPSEINPNDEYAVEEALRLRDASGGQVTVISMGPEPAAEGLRPALAMGADRALLIADPGLEGSDLLVTSRVLAAVLEREAPDLVVFGAQASDGGGAMLWSAVAERLRYAIVSGVNEVRVEEGSVQGRRLAAHAEVRLEAPLPCIVALSGAVNTPRYPSFRDVVAAKRKTIDRVSMGELGLDDESVGAPGSRTRVLRVGPAPGRRGGGEIVTDDGNGAAWLYAFLQERGFV